MYLVNVDLLLVLFPFLQKVLVLLLDDQLGQRVLRQRGGLGPVQGPVFGKLWSTAGGTLLHGQRGLGV